ncbi:hypothetical protein LBMAG27_21300 [Bacteroidota bacterium]|nr:hypothetical protein LBMAG27_21300 [Bacteroidota bacterium]
MKVIKNFFVALLFASCFSGFAKAQTLQAPDLQCANALANGDIVLTWSTPPLDPCGAFTGYVIWGSQNINGPYSIITTIISQVQTTYTITNPIAGTWYYYMESSYACAGYTALSSDTLDTDKPLPPVIDFVTVQSPAEVLIQFQPSTSPEAYSYIIYEVIGGSNFPIDTIYNGSATQYIDTASTGSGTHTYLIATMDSCGNTGLISTIPHNTIYAYAVTSNCNISAKLVWNKYKNWVGGVNHYDVFVSINNQPSILLATVTDTSTNFTYTADSLCFTIVAHSANGLFISSSNIYCLPPNPSSPVQDFYIRNVTVAGNGIIDVYYSMNKNSDIRTLKIERGTDGVTFNAIAVIDIPTDLTIVNVYSDSTPLTNELSYYYRFEALDSCGVKSNSTIGKSIWLDGGAYSNLVNHLNWENFELDFGEVTSYVVFRKIIANFDSVITISSSITDYEESVAQYVDQNGTICYVIVATDTLNFPNGIIDTVQSRSNEICIDQIVKILVPNAFAPNGKNNTFKPVLRFVDNKSYLFQVYNRWGGLLFSTKDATVGWDGFYQGQIAEQGVYAYLVQVVDNQGHTAEQKGTVMLLR